MAILGLLNWIIYWIESGRIILNWIFYVIESQQLILNWIIFWIEFSWNNIESNIELNQFWTKFKHRNESIWVSNRARGGSIFVVKKSNVPLRKKSQNTWPWGVGGSTLTISMILEYLFFLLKTSLRFIRKFRLTLCMQSTILQGTEWYISM